jgi:hypothetical protein
MTATIVIFRLLAAGAAAISLGAAAAEGEKQQLRSPGRRATAR